MALKHLLRWERMNTNLFLETASLFNCHLAKVPAIDEQGKRVKHYYVNESVGIATGILISAIHQSGLASLTHTQVRCVSQ
jgi:hypothetical protein